MLSGHYFQGHSRAGIETRSGGNPTCLNNTCCEAVAGGAGVLCVEDGAGRFESNTLGANDGHGIYTGTVPSLPPSSSFLYALN